MIYKLENVSIALSCNNAIAPYLDGSRGPIFDSIQMFSFEALLNLQEFTYLGALPSCILTQIYELW